MASKKNKGPLVKILDSDTFRKIGKERQDTDMSCFLYDENKRTQLMMTEPPEILVFPESQEEGIIRLNKHKTVPLNPDNTFYYGAWPQNRVSPNILKKLKEKVKLGEKSTGFDYSSNGKKCEEYELNGKLYVLVINTGCWFEVNPIKWRYDPRRQITYTEKSLWNLDETDEESLDKKFWKKAFHATEKLKKTKERKKALAAARLKKTLEIGEKEAKAEAIHAIRLLRDKENQNGGVSKETEQIYKIFKSQLRKRG